MFRKLICKNEGCCWNETTVRKRIKQYDDIVGYTLEEIIIAREYQHKGLGSMLLKELEKKVRERGASCVELQAVNDELHAQYYGKSGYRDVANFVMKVKWFE